MHEHMEDAIADDSGESIKKVSLKETNIKKSIQMFFHENVKDKDALEINTYKADVQVTNLRTILKGEFTYNTHTYDYIIKTEHTVDFQEVEIFQLKIDGVNIDFE